MNKTLFPGKVCGTITPPCSKSYAQRALAVSLLCEGESTLRNIELCDDTRAAMECIEALGAHVEVMNTHTLRIRGGLSATCTTLHVGESGLSTRLFTPIAALVGRPMLIEGRGSLLQRPMTMMINPLRQLGVTVTDNRGYLPFQVCGPFRSATVEIDGSISSQFITGLLLALPHATGEFTLRVKDAVSTPYIDMTIDTAQRFGVEILHNGYTQFYIEGGQHYRALEYSIEGDWSAAAPLLVAGAIAGEVTLNNISSLSKQADTAVCTALERAGAELIHEPNRITVAHRALRAFNFDATQCPDLFPPLVALAAACTGESTLKGTSRLTHKESNRALTLQEEYQKLGIEIDLSTPDLMRIRGGEIHAATVHSHGDHRIAMSLAVSALRSATPFDVEHAEAIDKSYPRFFDDLAQLLNRQES